MAQHRTLQYAFKAAAPAMAANSVWAKPEAVKVDASAAPVPRPGEMVDALHMAFGDHHVRAG
jgi:hypothetical protein